MMGSSCETVVRSVWGPTRSPIWAVAMAATPSMSDVTRVKPTFSWAVSTAALADSRVACAAFCYGFMLDAGGSTIVADASTTYRFVNPCAGKSVADVPRGTPLFVVRAGRDEFPRLNETIDGFVAAALAANLPMTVVNYAGGSHAFDIVDDSDASREVVKQILAFLRGHLRRGV